MDGKMARLGAVLGEEDGGRAHRGRVQCRRSPRGSQGWWWGSWSPAASSQGCLSSSPAQSFASSRPQSWSRLRPCHPCHSPRWPPVRPSRRPREPHLWTSSSSRASGTCSSRSNTCWPSDRYDPPSRYRPPSAAGGTCCPLDRYWPLPLWPGAAAWCSPHCPGPSAPLLSPWCSLLGVFSLSPDATHRLLLVPVSHRMSSDAHSPSCWMTTSRTVCYRLWDRVPGSLWLCKLGHPSLLGQEPFTV